MGLGIHEEPRGEVGRPFHVHDVGTPLRRFRLPDVCER
jgi:hypothetical protein